jgi:hypothetical protein
MSHISRYFQTSRRQDYVLVFPLILSFMHEDFRYEYGSTDCAQLLTAHREDHGGASPRTRGENRDSWPHRMSMPQSASRSGWFPLSLAVPPFVLC